VREHAAANVVKTFGLMNLSIEPLMKHYLLPTLLALALLLTGRAAANTGDDFGNGPTIVRLHSFGFSSYGIGNGTGTLVGVHRYGNRLNMVILATEHTARRMGTMTGVGFESIGAPIGQPGGVTISVPLDSSVSVRTARYGANGTTDVSLIGLSIDLNNLGPHVPKFLPFFPPATLAVAPPAPFTFNCTTYGTDGGDYPDFGFRNKFSNVVDSIAPFTGSYTTDSANNPLTYTQQLCQWDFDTVGGVPGEGAVGAGGEGSPIVVNGSVVGIQVIGTTAPNGVSYGVVFDAADVAWFNGKIDELLEGGNELSFLATSGGALNPSFDPNLGALTPVFQPDIKNYTQTTTATHMTCFPIRTEPGSIVQSRINGGAYFTVDAKPPISTGGDAGGTHCWAIRDDGSVASWGHAGHGAASVPANLTNVKEISVGGDHGIALFQDGRVSGWGGWVRQSVFYPAIPAGLFGITQVCTGSQHTFLLSEMGKVTAYGQYVADSVLDPPGSVTDVSAIATGNYHGLALKRDGTVVAWGAPSPMTNVPAGLNNVVAIAASEFTSMALKRDGNVVVWGDNRNGQNDIPSYLQGNIVAITAGNRSVIVLYRDGTIGRWGSLTPILPNRDIPGILGGDLVGVASYYNTHFVHRNDGLIIGWGYNASLAADAPVGLTTSRSSATPLMALNPGLNTVEFKVTPPSGLYPQTYTIAVNRLVEAPPTVSALTPVQVLSNTATFSVDVNPRGRSTEMRLQYSTDQSFNLTSPYVDVPAGHFPVTVNRTISGLQPGTIYYCRMRAVNIQGTTYSPVFQFTTELPAIPTISGLPPQEVLKGGVSPWLDFTVGPGPYAGQITMTGVSDNLSLLPVSGISFADTGPARRVRLRPGCGQTGTAVVTLTATLGGLTATTSFTVNVVDRPPAEAAQIVGLGSLPAFGGSAESTGLLISGDGDVVAGRSAARTFRWTAGGGMQDMNMFSDPQTNMITLTGISTDGSVIGGYIPAMPEAYLWTPNFGLYQALTDPFQLNGLSGDGSVAVGHQNNPNPMNQPVRWTEAAGIQNLPKPIGATEVSATAISSDGMVVVGWGTIGVQKSALVWLDTISNPVTLLSVNGGLSAAATAVSADGGVIVGYSDSAAHPGIHRAVRWVRDGFTNNYTVYVLDGVAPTTDTEARGVSADGSRIVGTVGGGFMGGGTAFVWDAENGQQVLQTALVHGGANVDADWSSIDEANGISADGLYITGTGTRSSTLQREAFRAKLPRIPPTPTISAIADFTMLVNTASPQIPFTLTDPDSNPVCLGVGYGVSNPALLPVPNVVLGGAIANRTITVTPAAGQTGQVMIVLTVSDGFSSSDVEFIVNVVSADSLDGWRLTHFGSAASTGNGALTADPNLNGRTNLEEFAFGTNPLGNQNVAISYANGVVNQRGSPVPVITGLPGNQQVLAVFCRRANWQAVGLTYTVLFSANLINKVPSATIPTVLATDGEIEVVAVPFPATIEVGGQNVVPQFFQVQITKNP